MKKNEIVVGIDGLTEEEREVHESAMECYEKFLELPFQHPEDNREFVYAIHLIQGLLTMRIARRHYPNSWVTYREQKINGKTCIVAEKDIEEEKKDETQSN